MSIISNCFVLLLFHAFLIYSTSSFVLFQNGIQGVGDKSDPNSLICIEIVNETSCFPKVGLNQECELDEQCNSKTANSFCALLDDYQQNDFAQDIQPICLCKNGFTPSMGHLHCVPVQYCTYLGFNSIMEQIDCVQENQFCREGLCLCIPDHDLDYSGKCVPVRSNFSISDVLLNKAKESNKLVSFLKNILLSQRASTNKGGQNCCALLLECLGVALFLLGQIAWSLYL